MGLITLLCVRMRHTRKRTLIRTRVYDARIYVPIFHGTQNNKIPDLRAILFPRMCLSTCFIKKEADYRHCLIQTNRSWLIQAHKGLTEDKKKRKKPKGTSNWTTTVANMASYAISSSSILVIHGNMIIGTNHIVLACLCRHF
jgi:hypothetical protein